MAGAIEGRLRRSVREVAADLFEEARDLERGGCPIMGYVAGHLRRYGERLRAAVEQRKDDDLKPPVERRPEAGRKIA